jgi:hypothetical protein
MVPSSSERCRSTKCYAFGKVGGAFSFDGTVHVRVPGDSDVLKPAQITVEAWVFPTVVSSLDRQTIIA